ISPLTLGAREGDDVSHFLLCRGAPPPRPVPSRLTPLGFACNDYPRRAATPRGLPRRLCLRGIFPVLVGPHPHSLSLAPSRSLGPQAPAPRLPLQPLPAWGGDPARPLPGGCAVATS